MVAVSLKKKEIENKQENIIAQVEPENNLNQKVSYVTQEKNEKISIATVLMKVSNYFYVTMLIAMIIILLINIFKRVSIQHKSVIMQSFLVIILLTGLLFVKFQVLEGLIEEIVII